MHRMRLRHWPWPIIGLGMIVALALIGNIIWITTDQSPPLWDMAGHSARALLMRDDLAGFHLKSILTHHTIYPPFVTTLTGGLFLVFGRHEDLPQLSLLLFVVLGSLATYGIATKLFSSRRVGRMSVVILAAAPLAAHFSRIFDLDYPLMALTAASMYCLLRTNNFRDRRWSIILGIVVALGMLTKWTLCVFIIGPVLISLIDRMNAKTRWKNFGLAVGVVAILIGPWYALHAKEILRSAVATRHNVFSVPTEQIFSAESVGFYWHKTVSGMTWPLAVLGVAGMIVAIKKRRRELWMLLAWVFVPYAIMTFAFYSKESRYVLPLFPALAILGAAAIGSIKNSWIRFGMTLLVAVWCVAIWFQSAWGGFFSTNFQNALGVEKSYGFSGVTGYGYSWPTQYGGAIRDAIGAIQNDLKKNHLDSKSFDVGVVPNSIYLNDDDFRYYGMLANLPIQTGISNQLRGADWPRAILKVDYLVTKTGDQGPKVFQGRIGEIAAEEKNPASPIFAQFELIGKWPVHDPEFGYPEVRVYRRK